MRNTKLQQGCVLTDKDAYRLGLIDSPNPDNYIVVISHDCDLVSNAEEFVEFILGTITEPNSAFMSARHPRCLHLKFSTLNGEPTYLELKHANKYQIKKSDLEKLQEMEQALILAKEEKQILKIWLAARYGRPAFPDAFEERLRKEIKRQRVEKRIAKILESESASRYLVGLFFDLGKERFVELNSDQPYFLSISIVYDAIEGGKVAREAAERIAVALGILFQEAYGPVDSATEIVLENCSAVADTFMSLADLRKVDQWRLEYISLRENPHGALLAVGERPA